MLAFAAALRKRIRCIHLSTDVAQLPKVSKCQTLLQVANILLPSFAQRWFD